MMEISNAALIPTKGATPLTAKAVKGVKFFWKNFGKVLDKLEKIWYNIYVIKKEMRYSK